MKTTGEEPLLSLALTTIQWSSLRLVVFTQTEALLALVIILVLSLMHQ